MTPKTTFRTEVGFASSTVGEGEKIRRDVIFGTPTANSRERYISVKPLSEYSEAVTITVTKIDPLH